MNSLQDLNGYSNTAIVYQTANTGNVIISTAVNQTLEMPDYTNRFSWPVGVEVLTTGNVANTSTYTISLGTVDPGLANVAQAVTWSNLPNTFSITKSGYDAPSNEYLYQVQGPMTTANWNKIKSPVIQLGNTYNFANVVYSANVFVSAGNTANYTVTVSWPFDVPTPAVITYQEDILSDISDFQITSTQTNKIYQVTIEQDPVIGNIIIGNTYYGGQVTLNGNKTTVNNELANLRFLGNANSYANTTLYYSQKQITNGIQQAKDYPVALNSTGDLYDPTAFGGFRVLDSSGNYTDTSNVTIRNVYWNDFVYFEAGGMGVVGTGNTVSNVTVNFTDTGDEILTANVITVTPDAYSSGKRYQNYYAVTGWTQPGPSGAEESWAATVTATTTGLQPVTTNYQCFKYVDTSVLTNSQSDYAQQSSTSYRQGRQGLTLYTVDLPASVANGRVTWSNASNIQIDYKHYPDFGYDTKTIIVGPVISFFVDVPFASVKGYNLDTNTWSPALNATEQAYWDDMVINLSVAGQSVLVKSSGTATPSIRNKTVDITNQLSETSWGNAVTGNVSISQSYQGNSSAWSSTYDRMEAHIPITTTSVNIGGAYYGPNFTPSYGNVDTATFVSYWTKI